MNGEETEEEGEETVETVEEKTVQETEAEAPAEEKTEAPAEEKPVVKKPRVLEVRETKEAAQPAVVEQKPPEEKREQEPLKQIYVPKPKVLEEREFVDYSMLLPKGVEVEPDLVKRKIEQAGRDAIPVDVRPWSAKEIADARELAKKIAAEKAAQKGFFGRLKGVFKKA